MPCAGSGVDSARSWVTAAACFVIQFIGVGSIRGSGVLFVALMEHNLCSREEATWPFTIFGAASIIFAPMSGFLTTIFPVRTISMLGVLMLALGSSSCFFSTDLYFVSIFYGLLRAAGCSMCVNPIPGIINHSFQKHRASAMGLATAGDSVGALVFPLLIKYLLTQYLLKGTFLLLGAIVLQGMLGSVLLRETSPKKAVVRSDSSKTEDRQTDHSLSVFEELDSPEVVLGATCRTSKENGGLIKNGINVNAKLADESLKDTCVDVSDSDDPNSEVALLEEDKLKPNVDEAETSLLQHTKEDLNGVLVAKSDIIIRDHLASNNPQLSLNCTGQDNECRQLKEGQALMSSSSTSHRVTKSKFCSFDTKIVKNILTSRGFYLIQMCQIADSFLVNNYSLLIVDYVADKGIPLDKGLFMLTVFPIGQLLGRMGLGWITDKKYLSRPVFLFLALNLCAGLTYFLTYLYDYGALLFCGAILGVAGGSLHPTTAVLLSDYLRKEEVHMAIAITISIKGLAQLPRVPLVGYFRDQVGSYDPLFHVTVGVLCLSGLVWLCEGICLSRNCTMTKQKS